MTSSPMTIEESKAEFKRRGEVLRDESLEKVQESANADWYKAARKAALRSALRIGTFTTDDVWSRIDSAKYQTHEPRAMGAVMRGLAKDGLIVQTGEYVKTTRPEAHSRPIPVWRPTALALISPKKGKA